MASQPDSHQPYLTDVESHESAMSLDMPEVVRKLADVLGPTTVALVGGVSETRAVQQWMEGRQPQRAHVLRFALQLAQMISFPGDGKLARSWFFGSNPHLGDAAPAYLLRDKPLAEIQAPLVAAARSFAAHTTLNHTPDAQ
jgi:hypothetical protein